MGVFIKPSPGLKGAIKERLLELTRKVKHNTLSAQTLDNTYDYEVIISCLA